MTDALVNKLTKTEEVLFQEVIVCYEKKEYKTGVETADKILEKFPNHGETQSMKALILNCMGKNEEADALAKAALRNGLKSHICWHVLGLLSRYKNEYQSASKYYMNALRLQPHNAPIKRDLSWLQVQMGHHAGFKETRRQILTDKPSAKANWVSFAAACYVNGDYMQASEVVQDLFKTMTNPDASTKYEDSELHMFQNLCKEQAALELMTSGDDVGAQKLYLDAIAHLEKIKAKVVDLTSWRVKLAELTTKAGHFDAAITLWSALLAENSNNWGYHRGLQIAILRLPHDEVVEMLALPRLELPSTRMLLTDSQRSACLDHLLSEKGIRFASSRGSRKVELTLLEGDAFKDTLAAFVQEMLRKGVPSLYNDVCALFRIPVHGERGSRFTLAATVEDFSQCPRARMVLDMVNTYVSSLKTTGLFPGSTAECSPTVLLWALYLQAHLQEKFGDVNEALTTIDACIAHTPTALDMYLKKGKLLRKLGDTANAAHVLDRCRAMDLQDRYLNNKATKYMLRADQMANAMDRVAMFLKFDGDPQIMLGELQVSWYELEAAESYVRTDEVPLALKKLASVRRHFTDYDEDHFDFHSFCLNRKSTVRAYLESLEFQRGLYAHKFYQRALRAAVPLLVSLADAGAGAADALKYRSEEEILRGKEDADRELSYAGMSAQQKKKAKEKARKARQKAEKEKAEKEAKEAAARGEDEPAPEKPQDEDPTGRLYVDKCVGTTAELEKWLTPCLPVLGRLSPETLVAVATALLRLDKVVLCLRAVRLALAKGCCCAPMMPVLVSLYRRVFQIDGVAHSNTLHQDVSAFSQGALAELIATAPTLTGETNAQSAAAKQSVSAGMEGGVAIDKTAMEIHLENFLTTYADLVGSATVATGAGPAAVEARELRSRLAVVQCYEAVHGCGSAAFADAAERMLCSPGVLDGAGVKVGTVLQCQAYLSARATQSAAAAAVCDTFAAAAVQRFPLANALGGSAGDIVMLMDDAGAGLEAP